MIKSKASRDLRQALSKARERKLEERIFTARLLKQAGSKNCYVWVNTMVW